MRLHDMFPYEPIWPRKSCNYGSEWSFKSECGLANVSRGQAVLWFVVFCHQMQIAQSRRREKKSEELPGSRSAPPLTSKPTFFSIKMEETLIHNTVTHIHNLQQQQQPRISVKLSGYAETCEYQSWYLLFIPVIKTPSAEQRLCFLSFTNESFNINLSIFTKQKGKAILICFFFFLIPHANNTRTRI